MKLPLQVSFHNLPHSDAIENRVREEAARLDEFCDHIMSCRVVVDVPHQRHGSGNSFQVRVDVTVPGEEIASVNEPPQHDPYYEDVNVAIRDAFNSAARSWKITSAASARTSSTTKPSRTGASANYSPRKVTASSKRPTAARSIFTPTACWAAASMHWRSARR